MTTWLERSFIVFPAGSNGEFDLPRELSTVIARGKGCEIWDVEGRRFLDFSMGWGSVLVGHANPDVVDAVMRRAPDGSNFSYVNDEALLLAEEIIGLSPACERIRFCASGTEATLYCLRLARGFTQRPKVLKFEGAYHGAHETGVASLFPADPPGYPVPDLNGTGMASLGESPVLVAPFNDLEATRRIIASNAPDLAAVIVEPLQRCTPPREGFLAGLREACSAHGVLLAFDEVVTGFRLAYGGAQEYYGVVPDLVAYGKALGGGYPIGAYGGRRDILDTLREDRLGGNPYVWSASTLGGNPISTAAARAALSQFRQEGTYAKLHRLGDFLRSGMRRALEQQGINAQVIGDGPLAQVVFTNEAVVNYRSMLTVVPGAGRRLMLDLFRRGIFLNPMGTKLYLSIAHETSHCEELLACFAEALAALKADETVALPSA